MEASPSLNELGSGRYQIERELGRGGMGVVYEALDRERGTKVALKALRETDAVNIYRLKNEFRQLADISHRNLVGLHELVCDGQRWFFTMELVNGCAFDAYVARSQSLVDAGDASKNVTAASRPARAQAHGPRLRVVGGNESLPPVRCDVPRLRAVLRQLVEGILALHKVGKLHRDIKPSNVMVTQEGRVVVLDFGLVSDDVSGNRSAMLPRDTVGGSLFGTPAYVSPEQAASEPVTAASDWYSVGTMLYEALTGELPFEGSILEILRQKEQREARAPSEKVVGVPDDLNALCQALLRRNPWERPDGVQILGYFLAGAGTQPPQSGHLRTFSTAGEIFVGRERQLEQLEESFEAIKAGRPVVALINGLSGMGKSALANHFTDGLIVYDRAVVLRGRCYERESVPHKAFDNVIDALSRHLKQLPSEVVAELLPRNIHSLSKLFPVLRCVPAVAHARVSQYQATDPRVLQLQAYEALKDLLLRITDYQPLVIQVDDLQWGDSDSARLFLHVLGAPNPPPILWVGVYRRDEVDNSPFLRRVLGADGIDRGQVNTCDIPVDGMRAVEARHLVRQMLRDYPMVSELAAHTIAAEAGGVPFFIAELVRHTGTWSSATPAPVASLSLDDVIMERIGFVSQEAQRLLEVLAVAGRPLEQSIALSAADLDSGNRAALLSLSAARLVRTRGARQTDLAEVYHDRVRETVVARMDPAHKRNYHQRIADAIEASGHGDPERVVEHHAGALNLVRAGESAATAARIAAEKLAFSRAAQLYRRALDMLPANHPDRATLLAELGEALANGGRGALAAETYLRAASESTGREQQKLRCLATQQLLRAGRFVEARPMVASMLKDVGLSLPNSNTRAGLGWLWIRARVAFTSLPELRDPDTISPDELDRLDALGSICREFTIAEPVHGMMLQAQYLLLALRVGEPTRILNGLAWDCQFQAMSSGRRWKRKLEDKLAQASELAERIGTPRARGAVKLATTVSHLAAGQYPEALISAQAAEVEFRACNGAHWELGWLALWRNVALEFTGDFGETIRESALLARSAAERDDRVAMGLAAMAVGNAHLANDDPEACERIADAQEANFGPQFSVLHHLAFHRKTESILYRGKGQEAYAYVRSRWQEIKDSYIMLGQFPSASCHALRARAATAAYQESGDSAILKDAHASLRVASRSGNSLRGNVLAIAGTLAASQEKHDEAIVKLQAAINWLKSDPESRTAICAAHQLGELLGGSKGREMAAVAAERLRTQGIVNPARWSALIVGRLPADMEQISGA